ARERRVEPRASSGMAVATFRARRSSHDGDTTHDEDMDDRGDGTARGDREGRVRRPRGRPHDRRARALHRRARHVRGGRDRAGRRTTPLFGLGLVDSVPAITLLSLAAIEARWHPATAGRPNIVTDVVTGKRAVGKFGWKSQVPTLLHFSGDAYLNEMGITSPLFPNENCPQGDCTLLACDPVADPENDGTDVALFNDFMRLLAPPPRPRLGFAELGGSCVFDHIGCANCHVRTLITGASPVQALRFRSFKPFSDFLLHDMGSLGDGIAQGRARGTEMRTAPLWGLHLMTTFLHDGRATTIAD